MAQAKVTSLEALETFRSHLILFLTRANRSVNEVIDEVSRTRAWIQNDQRLYWEREFRRRTKILEQAEQELMSAKLSGLRQSTTMQQAAVLKAKRLVAESEEKRRVVKQWSRNFDVTADPLTKKLESLRSFLEQDLPKGVSFLANAHKTLEAYNQSSAPTHPPQSGAEIPKSPEIPNASPSDSPSILP